MKATLWLTAMGLFWASNGQPEGDLTAEQQKRFIDANTMFVGAVLSVLSDRLCDVYMHITYTKELWDALKAKFVASDAGSELYVMESFHDYKMADNRSVVEQAYEIQCIVKELELLCCVLPDQFVAGCMIAKLPPAWRTFGTSLKHKRMKISVESLIASLDVEEKARAKDTGKGAEGQSSANMAQKFSGKGKGKNKLGMNKTTEFKKKNNNK